MNIYVVFVLGVLLALAAQKSNKRIYVALLICLLSLFVGLRHPSVGIDTHIYYDMFSYLKHGTFSPNLEYGFSALSYLILRVAGGNIYAPFVVYAFITNALIISRLWSLRKDYDFSLSILLYMILLYPSSCNIMRQYVAIAIVFWATKYLDKNQITRFLICILIATSIHLSAAIAVVYIVLYMQEDRIGATKIGTKIIIIMMIPIVIVAAYYIFSNYMYYFSNKNSNVGLFNIVRLLFLLITAVLSKPLFSSKKGNPSAVNTNQAVAYRNFAFNNIIVKAYIIAIGFYFLGYMNTTMMRIGLYFGLYEILYISLACKKGGARQISTVIYAVCILYYFVVNSLSGWSGLGNYLSCL